MRRAVPLVVAVLLVIAMAPPTFAQESTGSISGQVVVTDSTKSFIAPVQVYDEAGTMVREEMSWIDSNFRIDGLPPGTYKVKAADRWFSSASTFEDADPVVVNAGAETAGIKINFAAAEFGEVEGKVYDALSGEPVCATVLINGIGVRPDESGYYRHGISPGSWRVYFVDNCDFRYSAQWFNEKLEEPSADVVNVTPGATITGIDAPMKLPQDEGGWISGKVTDAETGEPIGGICATPFDSTGAEIPLPQNAVRSPSADDGTYRIGFLGEGALRVRFSDCRTFIYEDLWWDGASTFEEAGVVIVQIGWEVGGIDAALPLQPGAVRPTPPTVEPISDEELPYTGLPGGLPALVAILLVGAGVGAIRWTRSDR